VKNDEFKEVRWKTVICERLVSLPKAIFCGFIRGFVAWNQVYMRIFLLKPQ